MASSEILNEGEGERGAGDGKTGIWGCDIPETENQRVKELLIINARA